MIGPGHGFGLVRTRFGFLLIDGRGLAALDAALDAPAGRSGPSLLRALAVARCGRWGLARMLRRRLARGTPYLNVGHANLTHRVLGQVRRGLGGPVAVLVHDTIPLDRPDLCAPGMDAAFARRMDAVAAHATHLMFTTRAARDAAARHLDPRGATARRLVAPLGIDRRAPGAVPAALAGLDGFILCVGTLEPRKNHALLIEIWERAGQDLPPLVLVGRWGWLDDAQRARLVRSPVWGDRVIHLDGVNDAALAALYDRAGALVSPSLIEGFGLPPVEAAACGLPVFVSDLPAHRETLGDAGVYLHAEDSYAWEKALKQGFRRQAPLTAPAWDDHIARGLAALNGASSE